MIASSVSLSAYTPFSGYLSVSSKVPFLTSLTVHSVASLKNPVPFPVKSLVLAS